MRIHNPLVTGSLHVSSSVSNEHYFIGADVGVGTISPSQPLHVFSSGNGGLEIDATGGAPTLFFDIPGNEQGRIYFQEDDTLMGGIVYESTGTDYISFKVESNTERMRLLGSEKLTIGTNFNNNSGVLNIAPSSGTSPTMYFEQYTSATNGTLGEISFGNRAVDGQLALIQVKNDGANDSAYMAFHTEVTSGALTERLRIDSSGNIGIGTTNPTRKLHVEGDAVVTGILTAQEFHTEFVSASVLFDSGSTIFGDSQDDIHQFTGSFRQSGSAQDHYFLTGNVGIGTTGPGAKLHIVDGEGTLPTLIGTDYFVIQNNGSTGDQSRMAIIAGATGYSVIDFGDASDVDAGGIAYQHHASNDRMFFRVNATDSYIMTQTSFSGSAETTSSFGMVTAGVSTAQAGGKFHVQGVGAGQALGIIEDTSGNANFLIKATASNKNSLLLFGDAASDEIGRIDYDHADNSLDFVVNNGTAVSINSSQQTTFNGNVRLGDSIALDLGSGIDSQLFNDGSDLKFRNNTSDQDMIFLVNDGGSTNTEIMRIDASTSRVGIGTATPSERLHVSQSGTAALIDANTNGNVPALHVRDRADTYVALFEGNRAGDTGAAVHIYHNPATSQESNRTRLNFEMNDSGDTRTVYAQLASFIDDHTNGTEDGHLKINTMTGGSVTEHLHIGNNKISGSSTSTGSFGRLQIKDTLLYDNGILDVGRSAVADPTVLIDSATGGDPLLIFDTGTSNRTPQIQYKDQGTVAGFIKYLHNGDVMNFGAGSSTSVRMAVSEAAIEFPTANQKISGSSTSTGSFGNLIVNGNGVSRVGIGTNATDFQLHILNAPTSSPYDNRAIKIENDFNAGYAEIQFEAGRNYRIGTGGTSAATGFANNLYLYDGTAAATRLVLNSSGNVGIGTLSPSRKLSVGGTLHVSRSDASTSYTTDNMARYIEIDTFTTGGGGIIWTKQSSNISRAIVANQGAMYFARSTADDNSAGATYDMFIKSTGEVGIGTTTPDNKLTVNGDITISGSAPMIKFKDTDDSSFSRLYHSAGRLIFDADHSDGTQQDGSYISFRVDDSEKMRISGSGRVGIGTTTPDYQLEVIGTARISATLTVSDDLEVSDELRPYEIRPSGTSGVRLANSQGNIVGTFGPRSTGANASGIRIEDDFNLILGSDNDYSIAYSNTRDTLEFVNGVDFAATRVAINSSGHVGIGDTNPSSLLVVSKSGAITDDATVVLADVSFTKTGGDADQSTQITGLKGSAIHNDSNSGFGNIIGGEFNATNTQNKNSAGNGDNIIALSANASHVAGIVNTVNGTSTYVNVDAGTIDQYVVGSNITMDIESAVNITGDVYGQKIYMDVDDTNAAQVWGIEVEDGGSGNWDGAINTSLSDGFAISGSAQSTGSFGQILARAAGGHIIGADGTAIGSNSTLGIVMYNGRDMSFRGTGTDRELGITTSTSSAIKFFFNNNNNGSTGNTGLGIGGVPADNVELDVYGDIEYTGTITDVSLRSIKENIVQITGSEAGMIDKFKQVPLYKYNLKPDAMSVNPTPSNNFTTSSIREHPKYVKNSPKYGLIADDADLENAFPELVQWRMEGEASGSINTSKIGIDTTSYIGMLHGVIKELVTKVETLETQMAQVSGSS